MPVYFDRSNPVTTPEAIAEFEQTWHVVLPDTYKEFLLKTNGGIGRQNLIYHLHKYRTKAGDCKESETFLMVSEVFGLSVVNEDLCTDDLHTVNVRVKQGDGERTSCLPDTIVIASEGDGHHYFGIVTSPDKYGQVHHWLDHNPDFEWSHKIADGFSEFLEKIINDPDA